MKNCLCAFLVSGLLATTPLHAGKSVSLCRDENGNPYFSDVGCPRETEKDGVFYVPNVKSRGVDLTRGKATADERAEIEVKIGSIRSKYNVQVHYVYSAEHYFPVRWRKTPISARGRQLALGEVTRLLPIIDRFLSAYPKRVLSDNLANIYLLSELYFYDESYGATNSQSGLYIRSEGGLKGFSDSFLLQRMHSEFSSILMRNHKFPEEEWRMANATDFEYRGTGLEMLGETDLYGQTSGLLSQGFIVKYAQSSVENDFNMIAYRLFTDRDRLRQLGRKYPRIKAKTELAIDFYKSIDDRFDFR